MDHRVGPFLPALGRVFTPGRETAFPASGGSLGSRDPWLLVSVDALLCIVTELVAVAATKNPLVGEGGDLPGRRQRSRYGAEQVMPRKDDWWSSDRSHGCPGRFSSS